MTRKPTIEELEQKIRILEEETLKDKRERDALRESEERYRTILETIEEGYYEADIAGNLTFINDSVCVLFGYSRDELIGMNNRQLTDAQNAETS